MAEPKAFAPSEAFNKGVESVSAKQNLKAASDTAAESSKFVAGKPKPPESSGPNDSGKGDKGAGDTKKAPAPKSSKAKLPHPYHQLYKHKAPSKQIAARTVLLATGGSLAVIAIANLAGSDRYKAPGSLFRAVGGTIIVGVGLLIIAEFESDLASMFALLVLVKVLLDNGDFVAKGIEGVNKAQPGPIKKQSDLPPAITSNVRPSATAPTGNSGLKTA